MARVRWERVGRVALLLVLFVVAGLYVQHALSYLSARSQAQAQQAIVRNLQRDNARLVREQRALRDPATIALDARRLGMVRPGERPYVVTGLPGQ
jgi:cell division protein FtsB